MKRILCSLLLLVMLLTGPVYVYADGIDLSQMSTDELLALRTEIEAEIQSRTRTDSYDIFNGDYIVGKHIQQGRYVMCATELITRREISFSAHIIVENPVDPSASSTIYFTNSGESYVLDLVDGMTLRLRDFVSATLKPTDVYAYTPEKG